MARNVEIRERVGGIFNHADSLLYPKTHVNMVDGLLESGKIKFDLLPDGVRTGLKNIGVITSAKTTAELLTLVDSWLATNSLGESGRIGCFVIAQYNLNITVSVGSSFELGDDGEAQVPAGGVVQVEATDWIMYNGFHSGAHQWVVLNNRHGMATTTVDGLMSFEDKSKLDSIASNANNYSHPTYTTRSVDTDGIVVLDTFTSDAQGHVTGIGTRSLPNATASLPGVMSAADKSKLDGIAPEANKYSLPTASATVLGGVKVGSGLSIASGVLANSSPNATHTGDVTGSGALTIANDVVTNTKLANMAQNTIKGRVTAGAGDPEDLTATQIRTMLNVEDGANAYSHPTGLEKSQDLTSVETIDSISFDTNGHIATLTKQSIRSGSTSVTGLLQLATGTELTTALNASKATTPVGVKAMIDYFAGMSRYADLTAANSATVSDGSIALVTVA